MLESISNYFNNVELLGSRFRSKLQKHERIEKGFLTHCMEYKREIKVNKNYYRFYNLSELPQVFDPSIIFKLLNLNIPLFISYLITPINRHVALDSAKARFSVLESIQNTRIYKGKNLDLVVKKEMNDANLFINKIISEEEFISGLELVLGIKVASVQDVNSIHKKISSIFKDLQLPMNIATFDQSNAKNMIYPFVNKTNKPLILLNDHLSSFLPFVSRRVYDDEGFFLGIDSFTQELIILDIFKYRNANINIFGVSGSGKSVLSKLIITRSLIGGIRAIILDPEGEYSNLVRSLKGNIYELSENKGIDPVELILGSNTSINTKVNVLVNFFDFFIDKKNKDANKLDKLIISYVKKNDKYSFKDFVNYLNRNNKDSSFINDINWLYTGSLSSIFNSNNRIVLNKEVISFDFSSLHTEKERIPIIYLIASFIKIHLNNNKKKSLIIIDEAHKLLLNEVTVSLYIDLVKTARKRNVGVISITQNPEDYKQSNLSRTILTQAELTFLLKQSPASLNYIKRFSLFPLLDEQFEQISTLDIGRALLIKEKENLLIDIIPFENEKDIVFT